MIKQLNSMMDAIRKVLLWEGLDIMQSRKEVSADLKGHHCSSREVHQRRAIQKREKRDLMLIK